MNKEFLNFPLGKVCFDSKLQDVNPTAVIRGNSSHIWIADDEGKRYVIKQYPEWIREKDISLIHQYMNELYKRDFPLTEPKGEPFQLNKHFYGVYSFADGTTYNPKNPAHLEDMARKLRMLFDLSQNIRIDGQRNWPIVSGFNYKGKDEFLMNAWETASELLQNNRGIVIPIHGDFRKNNIRFSESGITKVFDFGNARNDYPEVDLAITLRDIGGESGSNGSFKLQEKFLQIYRNSGSEIPKIEPNLICASGIILGIQEISYLSLKYSRKPDGAIKNSLNRETNYLNFLLKNKDRQLLLYKNILA